MRAITRAAALLSALTLCLCLFSLTAGAAVSTSGKNLKLFEDFSGYTAGDYKNSLDWSGGGSNVTCEAGPSVAPDAAKSMKITCTSRDIAPTFWAKNVSEPAKINWTGAKYMMIYLQNTADKDFEIGFIITSLVGGDTTKTEHFITNLDAPAILETEQGAKTLITSVNGQSYKIPSGFKGAIFIPFGAETHVNTSWQSDAWMLKKIQWATIGRVSPIIITGSKDASFVMGSVYSGYDDTVNNTVTAMVDEAKKAQEKAESEAAVKEQQAQEQQTAEDDSWIGGGQTETPDETPADTSSKGTGTVTETQKIIGTKLSLPAIIAIIGGALIVLNAGAVLYHFLFFKKKVNLPENPGSE